MPGVFVPALVGFRIVRSGLDLGCWVSCLDGQAHSWSESVGLGRCSARHTIYYLCSGKNICPGIGFHG